MSIKGMREAAKFPCAEVPGQENNSLAAFDRGLIVLEPFVNHVIGDVALVQIGEMTELDQQAPQTGERAPKDCPMFPIVEVRQRHLEVADSGSTLPACQPETQ